MHNASLLRDAKRCSHEIKMANGDALELTQVGSVRLRIMAEDVERVVTLTDVSLALQLSCNIMSFGNLEQKGFKLSYRSGARSVVRRSDGAVAFDITTKNNVLFVVTATARRAK